MRTRSHRSPCALRPALLAAAATAALGLTSAAAAAADARVGPRCQPDPAANVVGFCPLRVTWRHGSVSASLTSVTASAVPVSFEGLSRARSPLVYKLVKVLRGRHTTHLNLGGARLQGRVRYVEVWIDAFDAAIVHRDVFFFAGPGVSCGHIPQCFARGAHRL
jgi:hypothetical protein